MLDTALLLRYRLYDYLLHIPQKQLAITQLADDFQLNYQQAVINLTEIDRELRQLQPQQQTFLLRAGKIDTDQLSTTLDEYRCFLLDQSIPFQYLLYLLNDSQPMIAVFCQRFGVSRSTISRKVKGLKDYLNQFNLRLTYQSADIAGDERLIRLALFNLLWAGTRALRMPVQVDAAALSSLVAAYKHHFPLSRSFFGAKEIELFAAIILKRTEKGHYVKREPRCSFLLKDNPYFDFSDLPAVFLPEYAHNEVSFIYMLAHCAPFYTLREDSSLQHTLENFQRKSNPVQQLVSAFLTYTKERLFPKNTALVSDPRIQGNLLNITFAYYVFRQPYPNLQQLMVTEKSLNGGQRYLRSYLEAFFAEYSQKKAFAFLKPILPAITKAFCDLLLPYTDLIPETEPVMVGVALEHNELFVRALYQFLSDLHFCCAEPYDDSRRKKYDVIITSSAFLLRRQPLLPLYMWEHGNDAAQLGGLYYHLRSLFEEKNHLPPQ